MVSLALLQNGGKSGYSMALQQLLLHLYLILRIISTREGWSTLLGLISG